MRKFKSILMKLLLLFGCIVFFYPQISDYINNFTQTNAIVDYGEAVNKFDGIEVEKLRKEAKEYNEKIFEADDPISSPDLIVGYERILKPFRNSMMAYVTIKKINVDLPIYHGVDVGVLQVGVGHLKGTSLPIGGKNTHAVITSHTGLPSANLFTDLVKLEIGDKFVISVLCEDLYYKIDQIKTVLPDELDELRVVEGKDYVTMVTCTPYGINTHRLLVRGERIAKPYNAKSAEKEAKDTMLINTIKFVAIMILLLIIVVTIIKDIRKILKEKKQEKTSA